MLRMSCTNVMLLVMHTFHATDVLYKYNVISNACFLCYGYPLQIHAMLLVMHSFHATDVLYKSIIISNVHFSCYGSLTSAAFLVMHTVLSTLRISKATIMTIVCVEHFTCYGCNVPCNVVSNGNVHFSCFGYVLYKIMLFC